MKIIAALIILLLPDLAFAEVSDKFPSIEGLIIRGMLLATLFVVLIRHSSWFVLLALAVSAMLIFSSIDTWFDLPMREALLREQGMKYFYFLIGSDLFVFIVTIVAWTIKLIKLYGRSNLTLRN